MVSRTILFTTIINAIFLLFSIATTPSSASPISKRFIPLPRATSIDGSQFFPLSSPSSPKPSSQGNIQLLSTPVPEYPSNSACVAFCDSLGYLSRDEREKEETRDDDGVVTVHVMGRWITDEEDTDEASGCDCEQIKLVYDLKAFLSTALSQETSTPTSTSPITSTLTSNTSPPSSQSSPLSSGAITAIILASFFLLLLCILLIWIGVVIFRTVTTKRAERQKKLQEEKGIEAAATATGTVDDHDIDSNQSHKQEQTNQQIKPTKPRKDIISFLHTNTPLNIPIASGRGSDMSESREGLIGAGAGWRSDEELQRYEEYLEQEGIRIYEDYEVEDTTSICSSRLSTSESETIDETRLSQIGRAK